MSSPPPEPVPSEMVVLQYGNRTVKGYSDKNLWSAGWSTSPNPVTPPIRLPGSDTFQHLPLAGLKAAFFVKSFAGKSHEDLRFHDDLHAQECLWVRITFHDGEVIEGLVQNSAAFVLNPGFLIFPIDPEGNNLLVYTFKIQLRNLEVLGLRPTCKLFAETPLPSLLKSTDCLSSGRGY